MRNEARGIKRVKIMSLDLCVILEFGDDIIPNEISNECFKFVSEACKRKIAINQIAYKHHFNHIWQERKILLKKNAMTLELSNSYVFRLVEEFFREYDAPEPSLLERLGDFQALLKYIFNSTIVDKLSVYVCDDFYSEESFELIECSIMDFSSKVIENILPKYSFAYKFSFIKET